jgi:hypothetical protein
MAGTVEAVALEFAKTLEPLEERLTAPHGALALFAELGLPLQPAVMAAIETAPEVPDVVTAVTKVGDEVPTLTAAITAADRFAIAASLARLVPQIRAAFGGLQGLAGRVRAAFPGDLGGLPQETRELIAALPERLLAWIVVSHLDARRPLMLRVLAILGLMESTPVPAVDSQPALIRRTLHVDRVGGLFKDPDGHFSELYRWGDPATRLDASLLLARLHDVVDAADLFGVLDASVPELRALWFSVRPGSGGPPTALELRLAFDSLADVGAFPSSDGSVSGEMPISGDGSWVFRLEAGAELASGIVFRFHPSGLQVDAGAPGGTVPKGSFRVELVKAKAAGEPAILLLGDPDGTRLEAQGFTFGIGGEDGDFYVAAGVKDLRLVIDVSGDDLLSQIVREPVVADAGDLVGGWRLERGIYFEQGSGLSLRFPLNVDRLGIVALRQLGLGLEFDAGMALTTTVSGELSVGPLFLAVEELGFRVAIVPNWDGTFGMFDLDVGVRFPTGYGAQLEAGPISGGGQLAKREHEYRGALSLRFESFGLSAYAVLTTRMPSGESGFSFLASIFGDLEVQLGYGFKLTGVGGIIGIDRGADVEQLQAVLADGRLDSVLFPRVAIRDAAVILDDMAAIFPPRRGQYLVGPMARLAWGTPTLIEGKLGVVLEVGAETRAVVVGSLETVLPVKSAAVVVLRVDFIGTVEFATGSIGFDARLTNSRILSWPVSGEAAVRTGWGPSAGLVASVGGFHPAFAPPPGFPNGLQPMTVDFATNNPSLTLTAYLAVTLNSVQAGANASLYAKGPKIPFVGRFAVEGSVGFDALIYFDPFAFDAKLWLGLDLLLGGNVVCGIGGDLRLRGPNRYEISGKVSASVLGVSVKVKVNKTWGTPVTETPQMVDGVEVLRTAVRAAEGFEPIAVTTRASGVGFARQTRGEARALIDPSGGVRFVQRALPLAVAIDCIGTSRLVGDANTFDLAFADNGSAISGKAAMSEFVRGAFFDLDESERLRGPATERHKSGIELHGPEQLWIDESAAQGFDFEYETIFLGDDGEDTRPLGIAHPVDDQVVDRLIRLTAERTSTPLNSNYVPGALGQRIGVAPITYVVVGESAVDSGPRPAVAPDGSIITGPLSSVVRQRGRDERAIARYLAAPVG